MSLSNAKILKKEPLPNAEAKWTKLVKVTYEDPNGVTRTWESVERTTRPAGGEADGVAVAAILQKPSGPELVLLKQFRPPTGKINIELPAGLIDAGETFERAAERELFEETGYVGKATETSPIWFNDSGLTNANLRMVQVSVDLSLPENQNPQPRLEEEEFIEVFTVPLASLSETCLKLDGEGYAIDARLGSLAMGIDMAKRFSLWSGNN